MGCNDVPLCAVTYFMFCYQTVSHSGGELATEPEAEMTSLTLINPIDTNTFTHLIFD